MPQTRSLITYPNNVYVALVNRVLSTREPFLVPCSPTQAATMRGELHAWRRAAEAEPGAAATEFAIPVNDLRQLSFRITKTPTPGLEVILTDSIPSNRLILDALGLPASEAPRPADNAAASLATFMSRIKPEEPGQ